MAKAGLEQLSAFLTVARERSFTKAAAGLRVTQPALSKAMRDLEARLGVRLLNRTTRSVSLTDAGGRLFRAIAPDFEHIAAELDSLGAYRDKPIGVIRISIGEHAARTVVWPKLPDFARQHPGVKVELTIDHGLTDIAAEGFDAGVRLGERLARDMIAVRIGPDLRMVAVASPAYFYSNPEPRAPRDLTSHNCINLRMPTYGGALIWEFEKKGRTQNVRVDGQLTFNSNFLVLSAALEGLGIGFLMEDVARPYLASRQLKQVLSDWSPTFPGYHIYYPSRRQTSSAFAAFVSAMRV